MGIVAPSNAGMGEDYPIPQRAAEVLLQLRKCHNTREDRLVGNVGSTRAFALLRPALYNYPKPPASKLHLRSATGFYLHHD
jgi:hypothetical protein